jgi:hypothetical protein
MVVLVFTVLVVLAVLAVLAVLIVTTNMKFPVVVFTMLLAELFTMILTVVFTMVFTMLLTVRVAVLLAVIFIALLAMLLGVMLVSLHILVAFLSMRRRFLAFCMPCFGKFIGMISFVNMRFFAMNCHDSCFDNWHANIGGHI